MDHRLRGKRPAKHGLPHGQVDGALFQRDLERVPTSEQIRAGLPALAIARVVQRKGIALRRERAEREDLLVRAVGDPGIIVVAARRRRQVVDNDAHGVGVAGRPALAVSENSLSSGLRCGHESAAQRRQSQGDPRYEHQRQPHEQRVASELTGSAGRRDRPGGDAQRPPSRSRGHARRQTRRS